MLSLRQLLTPVSEDDFLAFCLETLDSLGFQATSWQANSAARTLTQLLARIGSDLTFSIADIVAGGFAGLAKGPYADMVGQYMFNLLRVQATATVGQFVLTSSPAAPPYTFSGGDVLIGDAPLGTTANTFTVQSGPGAGPWTLAPGASMLVTVQAASPGAQANRVPPSSATLTLWGGLGVGITITNPPNPPTTPVNTWIITPGTDTETDGPGGRYNARMLGRWARLSYSNIEGAYAAWVLEAVPAITRLRVREASADFSVQITAATATGGISGSQTGPTTGTGQVGQILDYLNGVTDSVGRRPINDVLLVQSAAQITAPALTLTIYVKSPFASDAVARVTAALNTLIGLQPIGGKLIGGSGPGFVLLADLYAAVMAQQGLQNVVFASPTADILMATNGVYAAIPAVTMVIVP